MPRYDLVALDMDGVLVDMRSSWRYIHTCFATDNRDTVQAYLRGDIGSREFMERDIALWRRANRCRADLEKAFDRVAIMPGARECIQALHEQGVATAIVSGGLDILARRIAAQTGIRHVLANGIHGELEGSIVRVPIEDKGTALRDLATKLGVPKERMAAVGNSRYDISMFEASGLGIAFNPCDQQVVEAADVVIKEKDLTRLLDYLLA
ncbi:MAG: HAD family hydrolase [Thermoplasmatota archaeon]